MTRRANLPIAAFISSHGFGHAARACAVMERLLELEPQIHFDVFTRVPRWFFDASLPGSFTYEKRETDVGVIQTDALTEDLSATVRCLDRFYPLDETLVATLADRLQQSGTHLVLCDIAPLGIVVAQQAGIPSVLVENFTWDWIYAGYVELEPRIGRHNPYLAALFASADLHVQTEPVCARNGADMTVYPFSRKPKRTPAETRRLLGVGPTEPAVVVTMGGIQENHAFLERLQTRPDIRFLIPGATRELVRENNLTFVPYHPAHYHPDLVRAADAVVGKVGYGTISEVYEAGIPFGFIPREESPESGPLVDFVRREIPCQSIPAAEFRAGAWIERLDALLGLPRVTRNFNPSAQHVARRILDEVD